MIFQIASDIHIEKMYPKFVRIQQFLEIQKNANVLILAGDIGSIYYFEQLKYFLTSCKEEFSQVIYVPGNNEYYLKDGFDPKSMEELNDDVEQLCKDLDIILLNNAFVDAEDVVIFGSTWWSYIPETLTMKIFKKNGQPIDSEDFNLLHLQSRLSLTEFLNKKWQKKILVITHYCPTKLGTMNLHHKKADFSSLVPYYFSSSEKYLKSGVIDAWIFGHTHVFRDFIFNGDKTRIISNADPRKNFFKPNFCIEL